MQSHACTQHHSDQELGLSVIDRLTYFTIEYFEKAVIHSSASTASSDADSRGKTKKRAGGKRGKETGEKTVSDLLKTLRSKRLMSTVEVRDRLYERDTRDVSVLICINTAPYNTIYHNTICHNTIYVDTTRYSTIQYDTITSILSEDL